MRKFIIKNYKNIGVDKEVFLDIPDQGGLCVILGENNAGKSNVLGALKSFGKKNLTENDIPNYYFSGFNNGQYETEISLSSDNFFNEGKKETIDYKKYKTQSDEKFEIIPPSVIEKEFYINKFALAFNKKTMDGVIKTSGLSEGDVIKQYNEELLSEPVVFAYYVNNRIDGKLNIGTIYLYFPKMAKILCAKGGTNSTYNLVASCKSCNKKKSNKTLKEFGKLVGKDFSHLKPKRLPKDASIVQLARNYMIKEITKLVADTTLHDAWMTKYNRDELGLPKQHYYDALSVGEVPNSFNFLTDKVLQISAKGRGSRQMCRMNKYGFPRTSAKASKSVKGFQTGDMVKAIVPKGSKQGEYLGKVAVRSSGYFDIQTKTQVVQGIGFEYCHIIQRSDGYLYSYKECDSLSAINNRVSIAKI